ncbi:MAG: TRAFs-binding domain-containing protein [Myxococcales bacterium]
MTPTLRPMCFVAMPFGRKSKPGADAIDFDDVYEGIRTAVEAADLECIRADYEQGGGFIHRPMYERLLVAEYVVADLTLANANVAYEVGVRHGARTGATILLCEASEVASLPFDLRPLRVITYDRAGHERLAPAHKKALEQALAERLRSARAGELPDDNPIVQITRVGEGPGVGHEKTDVFMKRLRYAGEIAARVADALAIEPPAKAVEALVAIEGEVLGSAQQIRQLHTSLLSLYLAYREKKAWDRMVRLFGTLPRELQQTPVAREQLALALNRQAEEAGARGDRTGAAELRNRALQAVKALARDAFTSETWGIIGRIEKGRYDELMAAGDSRQASGALQAAIDAYEQGVLADPRDYYPGVNAVTLRLVRGTPQDEARLARILPVVRFAVERAPPPDDPAKRDSERYWQEATRLELACAARDWAAADEHLQTLLGVAAAAWMRETTAKNLRLQARAGASDREAATKRTSYADALAPAGAS